jgi:hypothetical protein
MPEGMPLDELALRVLIAAQTCSRSLGRADLGHRFPWEIPSTARQEPPPECRTFQGGRRGFRSPVGREGPCLKGDRHTWLGKGQQSPSAPSVPRRGSLDSRRSTLTPQMGRVHFGSSTQPRSRLHWRMKRSSRIPRPRPILQGLSVVRPVGMAPGQARDSFLCPVARPMRPGPPRDSGWADRTGPGYPSPDDSGARVRLG